MASINSEKKVKILLDKVHALEKRIKFLEHYLNMDEEAIQDAMIEKGDVLEEELQY
jgi:hypothetical protein